MIPVMLLHIAMRVLFRPNRMLTHKIQFHPDMDCTNSHSLLVWLDHSPWNFEWNRRPIRNWWARSYNDLNSEWSNLKLPDWLTEGNNWKFHSSHRWTIRIVRRLARDTPHANPICEYRCLDREYWPPWCQFDGPPLFGTSRWYAPSAKFEEKQCNLWISRMCWTSLPFFVPPQHRHRCQYRGKLP